MLRNLALDDQRLELYAVRMSRKSCTNQACAMKGTSVETDRSTCVSCGRSMSDPFSGLIDDLLGTRGGGTGAEAPAEVMNALRGAEEVLASFLAGKAVKRSALEAAQIAAAAAIRRFG